MTLSDEKGSIKFWYYEKASSNGVFSPVKSKEKPSIVTKNGQEFLKYAQGIGPRVRNITDFDISMQDLPLDELRQQAQIENAKDIYFEYTNHQGFTSERHVIIHDFFFGTTEYHKERQWFFNAHDLHKNDTRTFALKDCNFNYIEEVSPTTFTTQRIEIKNE